MKSKDEIKMRQYKMAFNYYDLDGDGYITSEEFSKVLTSLGDKTTKEQAAILVKSFEKINFIFKRPFSWISCMISIH